MMLGASPLGQHVLGQSPVVVLVFYEDTEIVCVHGEPRALSVQADDTVMDLASHSRTMTIGAEARTVVIGPRKRVC